jgi:hypothetical protein
MAENRKNTDQFQLRLPPGLRDQLKKAASDVGRSLNAEIVARIEDFPRIRQLLFDTTRENARLSDDKERLELELDALEEIKARFFDEDEKLKPVITIPQDLLERIEFEAERSHRTVDAEALAALEVAFPPKTIDVDTLSSFLESLIGISAPDAPEGYLDEINSTLAKAKQPWTVRAGWDGEISFYPFASPPRDDRKAEDEDDK